MTRTLTIIAAAAVVFACAGQGAQAKERHDADRRLAAVSIGVGAASTAGYFAINHWRWKWDNGSGITHAAGWGITTIGCAALSPMVATVVLFVFFSPVWTGRALPNSALAQRIWWWGWPD